MLADFGLADLKALEEVGHLLDHVARLRRRRDRTVSRHQRHDFGHAEFRGPDRNVVDGDVVDFHTHARCHRHHV
ncbi:hypothetical protein ABIF93_003769 [Bradyrhizobium japonicum]